ncbi:MAG: MFS transporter [Deltaproteobacteria bacterium]|nr:MFS transporter [Deltaproteobacteria bacterium]
MENQLTEAPLTFRETILYNLAGFSLNVYDTVIATWIMFFYMPPEGSHHIRYIPMALLGLILAGGRILDAVTDPLVGYLSDRTVSRWGRRKPFIFISAPLLFIAFAMIWLPPEADTSWVNGCYLAAILFVYYWAYTGVLIPWFAVLPEMRQENRKRVKIATIGVAIGVLGALAGGGLSGPLLEKAGAFKMALILGAAAFIGSELTLLGIREHPLERHTGMDADAAGFFRVLKEVFADRQVIAFSITIMLVQLTYQLMLMNVPYFTTLVMGQDEAAASMLMGKIIIIMALSTPLWYLLLSKFPKRHVFRVIMLIMTAGFILSFFIGELPVVPLSFQAVIVFALVAVPVGGMFAVAIGLIADLTDYDELKSGRRREAVYYGIYGIVRKTGWAFCSLIMMGVFRWFGFSAENPAGVRVIWLVCALACLLGFVAFIPYKIRDNQEDTRKQMDHDRAI